MSNEPAQKQPDRPLDANSSRPVGVPPPHPAVLETFTSTPPASSTFNTLIQISSSTGALPPPAVVAGYEQISPGFAERILAMGEKEQLYRHAMHEKALNAGIADRKEDRREITRGQYFALITGVTGLALPVLAVWLVPTDVGATVGSIIGGTTVVGLVTAFIVGRTRKVTKDAGAMNQRVPPR